MGAQVRKGEQSSPVVFWKINGPNEGEDDGGTGGGDAGSAAGENGASTRGRRPRVLARGYSVFNAAQVDGYAVPALPALPEPERIGHAEAFFAAPGADIRHSGSRACYVPFLDRSGCHPYCRSATPWPTMRRWCHFPAATAANCQSALQRRRSRRGPCFMPTLEIS